MKKGRRAQLDRENAHFILSEAMISTFEQVTSITDVPLSDSIGIHNAKIFHLTNSLEKMPISYLYYPLYECVST